MHGASPQPNAWSQQSVPSVAIPPDRPDAPDPGSAKPPPGELIDRAPTWLLIGAVIVVVALVAGGAYVVVKGGREYPSAWDTRVEPIARWVSEERELGFEHPVEVNFLTEEAYRARATEGGDAVTEADDQYYEDQAAQLRALGLLSGEVDLAAANDTLLDAGTLAYYDPDLEQVFVRGTELTPAVRVTIAHELVHVLQDQQFDLERLEDFDDGRAEVLRSLAEGDAGRIEQAYVEDVLTDDERQAYEDESTSGSDEAVEDLEANVPPILTTIFAAPYVLGPSLIALLDQRGGNEAINAALIDPPSEESLFDPRIEGTAAVDPIDVTVTPPAGAELIEQSEFGPTSWYLMLASRIDPLVALAATDGWGGDEYAVYRDGDDLCVSIAVETDAEADSDQLAGALDAWVAKTPDTATVERDGNRIDLRTCDPGPEAENAGGEVTADLLVLPVSRSQVYVASLQQGSTSAQAVCFSQTVVDGFTLEQLADPDGTFIASAEGQRQIAELQSGCA